MLNAKPYRNAAPITRAMPSAFEPSPTDGRLIATTPAKPMIRPVACRRVGSRRTAEAATSATNRGVAALIMPASEESIHCWAIANSTNGIAIQVTPSATICGQAERGTGPRAAGNAPSVSAPKAIRPNATSAGAKCSSPMSMKRNDAPQVSATPESISQSRVAKPDGFVLEQGLAAGGDAHRSYNDPQALSMTSARRPRAVRDAGPRGSSGPAGARPRRARADRGERRTGGTTSGSGARRLPRRRA